MSKQITRTGVYGVAMKEGRMLVIRQKSGPYAGKLDFPGGGIEFGELVEEALRREFLEEVGMEFDSMHWIGNFTATVNVPGTDSREAYYFFQIGMIYKVEGCRAAKNPATEELEHSWVDLKGISEAQCSALLAKYTGSSSK